VKAAVVLVSGGVDSSTLLHDLRRRLGARARLLALSFAYGQRHARELRCARAQARAVGVESHRVVELTALGRLVAEGSALVRGPIAVPDLRQLRAHELRQPPTYVPNRNMVLLAVAAAYAEAQGVHAVVYGAQAQDRYGYWDCTRIFLRRLNAVLALNRRTPVRLYAPYVGWRKAAVVRQGIALGVDFGQTWTCYRGGRTPCRRCPSCLERMAAFQKAGVSDPLARGRTRRR
jgi:7-cyano-7-deazaguanine synthase